MVFAQMATYIHNILAEAHGMDTFIILAMYFNVYVCSYVYSYIMYYRRDLVATTSEHKVLAS